MTSKKLLLISSSRAGQTPYLEHAKTMIEDHLDGIKDILFIPYAGVTVNYDDYTDKVQSALRSLNINVKGIHQFDDAVTAVNNAKAIVIGGGNTFHLLHQLYENDLLCAIKEKVNLGVPYIGWSAGSNVAGTSICTTNDMPIIEPSSFTALNLVPFQLNPHYTDFNPPGHNGETREQRLAEFMVINPEMPIVGIVEGSALKLVDDKLSLIAFEEIEKPDGFLFVGGSKRTIGVNEEISHLL
ncbi:MAG: dipeptidase PepE [Saccharospirillaceae bacterium]|nr:dipeptidase PepE [Colwellia sp.]NRB77167.1 dipeptidase PepE [Saccharospirillaceae bacterium]